MLEVLILVANSAAAEALQLIAGFILSAALYMVLCSLPKAHRFSLKKELTIIFITTTIGLVLPISGFAIVPVIAVLVNKGYPPYTILPMMFSNFLFNMLVPLSDVSFTWHGGFRLVVLAFAAGISAGIVLKMVLNKNRSVVNWKLVHDISLEPSNLQGIIKSFIKSANIIMPYLLIGVVANALFLNFAFMRIMGWVNTGPIGTIIPVIFKGYDITTPVFLLAMSILSMLMNLRNLSVLVLIFKFKGIFLYYIYFILWILLLATANFFTK